MQSTTQSPIHFSNHSTAHLRHTQPIIIPYHPLQSALAPTAARWLEMTHCSGQVCGWGETHRSAGWCAAVAVDVASKKNAIPRNHEQNLSSRELKNAWKGIGGISILAAHRFRSVPNCDVKRSVTCHVLWNSLGSRNVGHEVLPCLQETALGFCVFLFCSVIRSSGVWIAINSNY